MEIFYCNQYGERFAILNTKKYENWKMNNKVKGD